MSRMIQLKIQEQARKLQATLVQNYDRPAHSLTGVKCRATSVAKNEIPWNTFGGFLTSTTYLLNPQYFRNVEECEWALECLASTGLPLFASLCIGILHFIVSHQFCIHENNSYHFTVLCIVISFQIHFVNHSNWNMSLCVGPCHWLSNQFCQTLESKYVFLCWFS